MAGSGGSAYFDDVIIRNLQAAMFKRTKHDLDDRVVSMDAVDNYVVIGTAKHGCQVYNIHEDDVTLLCRLGDQPGNSKGPTSARSARGGSARGGRGGNTGSARGGKRSPPGGCACYNVCVSTKHIVYMKESSSGCCICVHKFKDVIAGTLKPSMSLTIQRRAPMVLEPQLGLLVVGSLAWKTSWTSGSDSSDDTEEDERKVKVINLENLKVIKDVQVAENSVAILRLQITDQHSMLGVADSRSGLTVLDLRQPERVSSGRAGSASPGERAGSAAGGRGDGYRVLYHVPVEEIRNFQLVGDFVGVFHRFEPNVSFWNMMEQKTILCINIQDQMRQLAEEFYEDEDDDSGLFDDDDDHVTAVTCVPHDQSDFMLIYGIKSGCIFGISVESRTKVFSIPYPHEVFEDHQVKRDVLGLCFLPKGKMLICYEGFGLTMLDFSPEDPPDRPPPTRCQHREADN